MEHDVYWEELTARANSLIDLTEVVKLAREVEELLSIDEDYLKESKNKILQAKFSIDILLRVLFTLLRKDFVSNKKTDTIVFHAFQENYGRLIWRLDKEVEFWKTASSSIDLIRLKITAGEIEEILYGDIYYPLDSAIKWEIENSKVEEEEKRRNFFYALFWAVTNNVRVFGSEARVREGKSGFKKWGSLSGTPLPSYEYLLSEKGQNLLEKGIDDSTKKIVEEIKGWDLEDEKKGGELEDERI